MHAEVRFHHSPSAVIVQNGCRIQRDSLQRAVDAQRGLVLVHCAATLTELAACSGHFESSIAVLEPELVRSADPVRFCQLSAGRRVVRVLVREEDCDPRELQRFLGLGCFGFVSGNTSASSWGRILRAVRAGEMWANRKLLSSMLRELLFPRVDAPSRRENEILELLRGGLNNKEIAERLFISQETLRWHLRNLYAKTGIRGRASLVAYARELAPPTPARNGSAALLLPAPDVS